MSWMSEMADPGITNLEWNLLLFRSASAKNGELRAAQLLHWYLRVTY